MGDDEMFEAWWEAVHPRLARFEDVVMPRSWVRDWSRFVFRGRPFVRLDTVDRTAISPFHLLTAALHRRPRWCWRRSCATTTRG